jgi:glucose/arabinose dehydrogenase
MELQRRFLMGALCVLGLGAVCPTAAWSQERSFYYQTVVTNSTSGATAFFHPTAIALAPDGQSLFVAQGDGRIFHVSLNSNLQVVGSATEIDTIYTYADVTPTPGRLITGMRFGPDGNLYVSHSDVRVNSTSIDTGSGRVTRLLASTSFTTYEDVAQYLPRSLEDHATNGLAFQNGKLYVAQGSMTNAGIPGAGFLNANETALSAAIFEFDLSLGLPQTASQSNIYATGLRNPYGLLVHSINHQLYASDNGPNLTPPPGQPATYWGVQPQGSGSCLPSNPPIVPHTADRLNRIVHNGYYGHPNPFRLVPECDFHAGASYIAPVYEYGVGTSSDGIAEYTSAAMPFYLNHILTANWGTRDVVSVSVSSNGLTAAAGGTVRTSLNNPLDLAVRSSDGSIFVAEYGYSAVPDPTLSKVSALRVKQTPVVDFDGDGRSDLSVYRPGNGHWYIEHTGSSGYYDIGFGLSTDLPRPIDYDGDGKTDLAVWRPSTGEWYIALAANSFVSDYVAHQWGLAGDIPVPGDYDGDGKTDLAIYRPSTGHWWILYTATGTWIDIGFGLSTDIPRPIDYDGDGKMDLAVWRPSSGQWYIALAANNFVSDYVAHQWGLTGDIPIPGDYDGDGKTDLAIYRPSTGHWWILYTATGTWIDIGFGLSTDIPLPMDVDGDGKTDLALWRPSTGNWYVALAANSYVPDYVAIPWGLVGDIPLGRAF